MVSLRLHEDAISVFLQQLYARACSYYLSISLYGRDCHQILQQSCSLWQISFSDELRVRIVKFALQTCIFLRIV
jgi:hypothetical protein